MAANYEFTTLTCIPGVIEYKGANIQLLDLPGIIEGASQGKGRGRQVRLLEKIILIIYSSVSADEASSNLIECRVSVFRTHTQADYQILL